MSAIETTGNTFISLREFARKMDLNPATVYRAVRRGRIPYEKQGREYSIPWPAAKDAWDKKRDTSKIRRQDEEKAGIDRFGRAVNSNGNGAVAKHAETDPENDDFDLFAERARKEYYLARLRALEYEERKASLVDARQVEDRMFRVSRQIRDALLNIPDRLAPLLAAENDASRCHALIRDELERILGDLVKAWEQPL